MIQTEKKQKTQERKVFNILKLYKPYDFIALVLERELLYNEQYSR